MRNWNIPSRPEALIFDLDSTLYDNSTYARFQTDILIERLARERGETVASCKALIERIRQERRRLEGSDTSLGNLFLALGIPMETSIAWREELIRPAEWLAPDARLDATLAALARTFPLCLVTNNPRSVGLASLEALGVSRHFPIVIGLDDTNRSKPDPAPFQLAAKRLGFKAQALVSIGDREDVDIRPALGLGMGGILITSVEEVYSLPSILLSRFSGF
ncbi:MAG TPA: HAD family hydrolase [Rectinemataceae bacterium]|nr:HAD family hydrolase [Rectinemataceae bacterium]